MIKLIEKAGVKAPHLEQVTAVGNPNRDPRGWSVTSLYMALIPYAPTAEFIDAVGGQLMQHSNKHWLLITQILLLKQESVCAQTRG